MIGTIIIIITIIICRPPQRQLRPTPLDCGIPHTHTHNNNNDNNNNNNNINNNNNNNNNNSNNNNNNNDNNKTYYNTVVILKIYSGLRCNS